MKKKAPVLEDYYCPEAEDSIMPTPEIVMKGAQKGGKKPEARVDIPWLQQAVDQGVFDDDDVEAHSGGGYGQARGYTCKKQDSACGTFGHSKIRANFSPLKSQHPAIITRTTKTGKVQELVLPQGPKLSDSIRRMPGRMQVDHKKIDVMRMKMTPRIIQEDFVDPFPQDLESFFFWKRMKSPLSL